MASTYLGLALPEQGTFDGQWGNLVNYAITDYLDIAVAGTTTFSTNQDETLTITNGDQAATNITANSAQYAIIRWTASNGATVRYITAPAQSKSYIVINDGTGSIVLRGVGPTAGITIVAGEKCVAAWSNNDFVKISSSVADGVTSITFGSTGLTPSTSSTGAVTVAGTLAVANGGTGATSLTANNVLLGNGTSAVQVVAPGTNGNVLTSTGTTWSSQAPAASGISAGKSIAFDLIFAI
jgi:hypothetical protein